MSTEKTIEVSAANGFRYQFVEFLGHILTYYWDTCYGKWMRNSKTFNTFDEAIAWAEDFGKKETKAVEITPEYLKAFEVPDDYYGVRGRYYGD